MHLENISLDWLFNYIVLFSSDLNCKDTLVWRERKEPLFWLDFLFVFQYTWCSHRKWVYVLLQICQVLAFTCD